MATNNTSRLEELYFDKLRQIYPEIFISDQKISLLLQNTPDEEYLEPLCFFLSHALKTLPDKSYAGNLLFEHVDKSPYDLRDWIISLKIFKQYIEENSKPVNVETIFGYIGCCSESPENKILKYKLPDLLNKMLNEYGYIG